MKRWAHSALGERRFAAIASARSRRLQQRLVAQWGLPDITRRLIQQSGNAVLSGPFKGMRYSEAVLLERVGAPLLLGSYESELHPVFASAPWREYACAIDVGAGEGYYAVGMARTFGVSVLAYETAPAERRRCDALAALNNVSDQVATRDWMSAELLASLCGGKRCFIMSDCEGYEIELFAPAVVPALSRSDLLIETHDHSAHVSDQLRDRLEASHVVAPIEATQRNPADWPALAFLGREADKAVREYRTDGQTWLWCRARNEISNRDTAGREQVDRHR